MAGPSQAELVIVLRAQDTASKVLKSMSGQLKEIDKQASLMSKAVGAAGTAMKGLAAAGAVGGVLAVAAGAQKAVEALTGGIGLANSVEQVRARLNAFTKDGAATEAILEQIRSEADRTPFAFAEMANAAAMLLPASKSAQGGLEGLIKQAEILAALNPSEGLEGAAFSLREALSGDFVSVMERFNIPRELINRLKDEGVPNAQIVGRALEEMGADFSLVANLANTTQGRLSTFQDGLARLQAAAGEPILDALGVALDAASVALDENKVALTEAATAIGVFLADAVKGSVTLIKQWGPVILSAAARLGELKDTVGEVLDVIGRFTTSALRPVIQTMGELARRAGDTATDWGEAWATVREVVEGAWRFLQPVLQAVADGLNRFGAEVLPELAAAWEVMSQRAQAAWSALEAFLRPALEALSQFWTEHGDTIVRVATVAWENVRDVIALAMDAIRTVVLVVLDLVQGDFDSAWDRVKALAANAWDTLNRVLGRDLDLMREAIETALDAVARGWQDAWNGVLSFAGSVWAAINATVSGALQALWDAVASTFNSITQTVVGSTSDVQGFLSAAWATIQGTAAGAWAGVRDAVVSAYSGIVGPIQAITGQVQGIINSISSGLNGIVSAAQNAANAVRSVPSAPSGGGGGGGGGATLRPGGKPGETQSEVDNFNRNMAAAGRASGGPVRAGTGYLVGEEGPELFIPGVSGTIIPAGTASRLAAGAASGGSWSGGGADLDAIARRVVELLRQLPAPVLEIDGRELGAVAEPYLTEAQGRTVRLQMG
jgi:phage-related protein